MLDVWLWIGVRVCTELLCSPPGWMIVAGIVLIVIGWAQESGKIERREEPRLRSAFALSWEEIRSREETLLRIAPLLSWEEIRSAASPRSEQARAH